jgi:hypothetical protein
MTVPTRPLVGLFHVLSFLLVAGITWPVEAIGGQLNLSWIEASLDVLGFSVERAVGIAGPFTILATTGPEATAYTDVAVDDATIYCYRVRAFNALAYSEYSAPACGATVPTALTLSLDINQQAFALGDRFRVDVTATNGGPVAVVDVYSGSLLPPASGPALGCPDGDAVAYLVDPPAGFGGVVFRCLSGGPSNAVPLYRRASVPGPVVTVDDFFGFNWPLTTAGSYTIFVFFTHPGTAEVTTLGIATVGYDP